MARPHVVIVGGGFGGLNAARSLRRTDVDVTLVDRRNFHLFQPLLYQVATGGLSPGNIAAPLRSILKRQKNCRVWLGEVRGFDLAGRRVILADGELNYDFLIVAAGSRTSYFGNDGWAETAPGLKSIEDALTIRQRVLSAFESAERETDPSRCRALLTFVVVGAGPTGVELAGTLSEIAAYTLRHEFRNARPQEANILLIDLGPRVLGTFSEELSEEARYRLEKMGITLRLGAKVTQITENAIEIETAEGVEAIAAHTILWAAGVAASPLGRLLAEASGCETDRQGRVKVSAKLGLPGHPEVFVIGDLAHAAGPDGKPLPGVAPVAMQQGHFAAKTIKNLREGRPVEPFRYHDYGSMATIGRKAAVAQLGRFQFRGLFAWVIWLFVHLIQIVQFQNRILILFQWAWSYFTFSRSARLITAVGDEVPLTRQG